MAATAADAEDTPSPVDDTPSKPGIETLAPEAEPVRAEEERATAITAETITPPSPSSPPPSPTRKPGADDNETPAPPSTKSPKSPNSPVTLAGCRFVMPLSDEDEDFSLDADESEQAAAQSSSWSVGTQAISPLLVFSRPSLRDCLWLQAGHWKVLLACYFCYMSKTFGEAAFDLTVPARQQLLGGSNAATATILSVGMGCYMAGKLLLGQLGDVLGGQAMFAGSLFTTGCAFLGISVSTKLSHLCVSWGAANFALACPWTGMVRSPGQFAVNSGEVSVHLGLSCGGT